MATSARFSGAGQKAEKTPPCPAGLKRPQTLETLEKVDSRDSERIGGQREKREVWGPGVGWTALAGRADAERWEFGDPTRTGSRPTAAKYTRTM